jgi:predicted negative regulator of RcsB-dependent stress response
MEVDLKKKTNVIKKIVFAGLVLFVIGIIAAWFIFTQKFEDTTKKESAFIVNAMDLIKEFQANDSMANKKYAEKIITVKGRVSTLEAADTTINIKMIDSLTDAYIIFAFQLQHVEEAKLLKEGDSVSIKGSCSGGTYSEILETEYVTFKRCTVSK